MLMLRKFFPLLTDSEFHCFLVGAHSTIAGFAFGLFVLFGVKAQHLLTGAVMSAPAAVAIAKLNYPETQESKLKNDEDFNLGTGSVNLLAKQSLPFHLVNLATSFNTFVYIFFLALLEMLTTFSRQLPMGRWKRQKEALRF